MMVCFFLQVLTTEYLRYIWFKSNLYRFQLRSIRLIIDIKNIFIKRSKIFQVVAVFGSMHMGASRIMNLQRHRIAQCRSIVIRILGNEGVPVQVDGEAWLHPPGIIRILHKNRVQLMCRDKVIKKRS